MTRERSFHEILEEKLHGKTSQEPSTKTETPAVESLADVLESLGNPVWTFASPTGARRAYPLGKGPKASTRPSRGPVHPLSDRQKDAISFFEQFAERLPGDFSESDLKGAYRRLALRLHPDMTGGATGSFLELRSHYKSLEAVFIRQAAA